MSDTLSPRWSIAVHGGAGAITRDRLSPDQDAVYRQALTRATEAGASVLAGGGPGLDAVESALHVLEDDPLFNAGRGAAFSASGRNELDAAIMDGATLRAGAVAGVTVTRHPITLARAVMERSDHVLLTGDPAEAFGRSVGVEAVDPAHFFVERRWRSLERYLGSQGLPVPPRPAGAGSDAHGHLVHDEGKHGTVGVVVCDSAGHVSAGTSTGGTTGKRWGRVGDSPIIGAGTYADDRSCAVSATGVGEYFIRLAVAHDISARMRFAGLGLQAAVDAVIQQDLTDLGGEGGVIAVAPSGEIAWSFNTTGMYRASQTAGGPLQVSIYKDEP